MKATLLHAAAGAARLSTTAAAQRALNAALSRHVSGDGPHRVLAATLALAPGPDALIMAAAVLAFFDAHRLPLPDGTPTKVETLVKEAWLLAKELLPEVWVLLVSSYISVTASG